MENLFLEGFVSWRHEGAQLEYEARSRNWIWLDKFTSYVIKLVLLKQQSWLTLSSSLSEEIALKPFNS